MKHIFTIILMTAIIGTVSSWLGFWNSVVEVNGDEFSRANDYSVAGDNVYISGFLNVQKDDYPYNEISLFSYYEEFASFVIQSDSGLPDLIAKSNGDVGHSITFYGELLGYYDDIIATPVIELKYYKAYDEMDNIMIIIRHFFTALIMAILIQAGRIFIGVMRNRKKKNTTPTIEAE